MALAATGLMMFTGCKKEYETVRLGVELETAPSNAKVVIDEDHNPVILDGDSVNVNGVKYFVTVNNGTYEVEVNKETSGVYYAAYPASLFNTLSVSGFSGTSNQDVHMSRWQVYKHNEGVQDVQIPAGAVITDGSKKLKFYNFCSLLEVQWKNTSSDAYDIIGIEVTVPGLGLYGDGTATLDGTNSTIAFIDGTKNRVNLDITETDRETVNANTPSRNYYIVLPPFSDKQVTVSIHTMKHTQTTANDQKIKTVTFNTSRNVSLARNTIVPLHVEATPKEDNDLTGYFSVADNYKVVFSRGNLQHVGSTNASDGTWKFADRQYDFFGPKNVSAYSNRTNKSDLFSWSNSGDNDAFGITTYDDWVMWDGRIFVQNGCEYQDWGDYKTISGDNPGTWYTLSSSEWYYLLHERVGGHGEDLFGKAKITGIEGMEATIYENGSTRTLTDAYGFILLPDDWTDEDLPSGLSFTPNSDNDTTLHESNVYSVSDWARMEAAGAVFLPAAGYGDNYEDEGSEILEAYKVGQYWSRTPQGGDIMTGEADFLGFEYRSFKWVLKVGDVSHGVGTLNQGYDLDWFYLRSVRLVKPAPGYTRPTSK